MSKHTPGPWVVGISADNGIHCVDGYSDGRVEICEVWGLENDKFESDESRANAKLIAAAPELLGALQRLYKVAGDRLSLTEELHVREPIAKAGGEA